jgi:hypothetical protein
MFVLTGTSFFPIRRFYLPGGYQKATGNGEDWDPATAPELIRDLRTGVLNDLYYIYIYIPAGQEFKFTQGDHGILIMVVLAVTSPQAAVT